MKKNKIDFGFSKSWKSFMSWYNTHKEKAGIAPRWEDQMNRIENIYEYFNPKIINWKQLWKDAAIWYTETKKKKEIVLWSEQKRAIESLMLNQLKALNSEQFVLVFLHKGKPEITMEKTTYWEALRLKNKLSGDANGNGGDEDMDKITIVNLSNLIQ